jgi:predicted house-cleaning noncanonical NTP pyrophosphatase (MazG superfamily)
MFKLIRDNIPELMREEGQPLDFAVAQNDEFFKNLLRGKLIEEVQEYLNSGDNIEELADIQTVLNSLISDRKAQFDQVYAEKLEQHGGFEKRYIGFFPDPRREPTKANVQTQVEDN